MEKLLNSLIIKSKFGFLLLLVLIVLELRLPTTVLAHCPLCVAGAGVGLSLAGALGIDDSITGVWIGALSGAVSFWTTVWLGRKIKSAKNLNFGALGKPLVYVLFFITMIWFFYQFNLVNKHTGTIFGVDKLPFGIVAGGILFYLVDLLDGTIVKEKRVFFPFQRIIVSLGSILLLSFVFYILINYYI